MRYGNCKINHNEIRVNEIDDEIIALLNEFNWVTLIDDEIFVTLINSNVFDEECIVTLIENNAFNEECMITLKEIDIVYAYSDETNATLREGKHVNEIVV